MDERRKCLTEEDAERIATSAAEKALDAVYNKTIERVYAEIGKGVVNKVLVMIGAAAFGMLVWAKAKGWI